MARTVTFPLTSLDVTNDPDQDIFFLKAGAANPLIVLAFEIYSAYRTVEVLNLRFGARSSDGSGGTAVTGYISQGGGSIAAACTSLRTAPGTVSGIIAPYEWDQQAPLIYRPTPAEQDEIAAAGRCGLNLLTAVGSTRRWSGFVKVLEYGG